MSRTTLSTIDLLIVIFYIVATTAVGAWFSRQKRDVKTYFVGDRNVSWVLVLISIVATETSAVTFLSVPGVAFNPLGGNLQFLQLAFGYVIGRCVVAWILLPQYMRGDLFSAYQVLQQRFSPAVQRVASAIFLATRTVADGLRIFLTALLLQYIGWGIEPAILILGIVTIVYTYLGGMKAVIWTDVIQFVIKIVGAALAGIYVITLLPGGFDQFVAIGESANKFDLFDFTFDPAKAYNVWAGVMGGAFFSIATHGADQMMVQRYLCARSLGQARTALVLSGVVILFQFLMFLLVGVALFALVQTGGLEIGPKTRNDEVFGAFIVGKLPVGVVGIVVAAVLAAAMSTLSSSLNSSANATVTDFYRPLRPGKSEAHYFYVSRGLTAFWGVMQMAVALLTASLDSPRSIVDQVLSVAGFTTGIVLGLFLLGSMRKPVSPTAALIGMCTGFFAVLAVWLPSQLARSPAIAPGILGGSGMVGAFPASMWDTTILAWPWFAPVGALTTVGVALLVNLFGKVNGSSAHRGTQPVLGQPR